MTPCPQPGSGLQSLGPWEAPPGLEAVQRDPLPLAPSLEDRAPLDVGPAVLTPYLLRAGQGVERGAAVSTGVGQAPRSAESHLHTEQLVWPWNSSEKCTKPVLRAHPQAQAWERDTEARKRPGVWQRPCSSRIRVLVSSKLPTPGLTLPRPELTRFQLSPRLASVLSARGATWPVQQG